MKLLRVKEWLNFPNENQKENCGFYSVLFVCFTWFNIRYINKLLAKLQAQTCCFAANHDANSIAEQYWVRISSTESQHFLIEFCLHNGKQLW